MIQLDRIKRLLGIAGDEEDAVLTVIKEVVQNRMCLYLGETEFPAELDWLADEVSVKRYNRLSSEGLESEGISGIVHKFEANMLAEFTVELDEWLARKRGSNRNRLVML